MQQLGDVTVEHEAAVAEDVEEDRAVLHLVIIEDLQQLLGCAAQLLVAERLGDEDGLQGSRVTDGDTSLKERKKYIKQLLTLVQCHDAAEQTKHQGVLL